VPGVDLQGLFLCSFTRREKVWWPAGIDARQEKLSLSRWDGDGGKEESYEDERRGRGSVARFRMTTRDMNPGGSSAILGRGGAILDGGNRTSGPRSFHVPSH
jgi:hypothetical protein